MIHTACSNQHTRIQLQHKQKTQAINDVKPDTTLTMNANEISELWKDKKDKKNRCG